MGVYRFFLQVKFATSLLGCYQGDDLITIIYITVIYIAEVCLPRLLTCANLGNQLYSLANWCVVLCFVLYDPQINSPKRRNGYLSRLCDFYFQLK